MCGIGGIAFADRNRVPDKACLGRMLDLLNHRGPDGVGQWVASGIALGHRRLSIIDVANGQQPLANETSTVWVTFNGEIYNYKELSAQLKARGHRFRTASDTEVLVHAYEEFGPDFVKRLNGMFAFALYDVELGRLMLARDHLGIKPLFYSIDGDQLTFASEIKAVLAGAGHTASLSEPAFQEYLMFRYSAGARTFFSGVSRLEAGHLAIWEHGELRVRSYWSVPRPDSEEMGLEDAVRDLDAYLQGAVSSQLMSEVALGAFCSGGVDSGLVTSYAVANASREFKTFSIGFDDPAWDETALAADTASRLGTRHFVVRAQPDTFQGALRALTWYNDEPLSHPNSVPLYFLSQFARQHVTVVLTGEGADELFGGYPRYHVQRIVAALDGVPGRARGIGAASLRTLPGHRAARLAEALSTSPEDALILNSAYVSPSIVSAITGASVEGALEERRRLADLAWVKGDPIASLTRYELLTYLCCALDRSDRTSMAVGLEARVPFLDVPLVEWGSALPSSLKVSRLSNKRVLKRLAQGVLSNAITRGRKSGFGLPLRQWFLMPFFDSLFALFSDSAHPVTKLLDRKRLGTILAQHRAGQADHSELLWLLLNVFVWFDVHVANGATAPRPLIDTASEATCAGAI